MIRVFIAGSLLLALCGCADVMDFVARYDTTPSPVVHTSCWSSRNHIDCETN